MLIGILTVFIIGSLSVGGYVVHSIRQVPPIKTKDLLEELDLNSEVLDSEGNLIEKLQSNENRTIVKLEFIPKDLQNAFIAIEDKRFKSHSGIDLKGIAGALVQNVKAGTVVRGASTLTQQLAKNLYLTSEVKLDRKIKEAWISHKIEDKFSKDQILEAYLNSIYLGEGAYGVQAAADTYFDKDVKDLDLAECAVVAGITKNPATLSPYVLAQPQNIPQDAEVIGEKEVLGEKYKVLFNPACLNRQRTILDEMVKQGYINKDQAEKAKKVDIKSRLVVKEKPVKDISSYFSDYLKESVVGDLMEYEGYSKEDADRMLYNGGLKIYATVDENLQNELEDIYTNLGDYIDMSSLSKWKSDDSGNIITDGDEPSIVYYEKDNILNGDDEVYFTPDEFEETNNGDIIIRSPKLDVFSGALDINDYFTKDSSGNLTTHDLGRLSVNPDFYQINEDGSIMFKSALLQKHTDFGNKNEDGDFVLGKNYYTNDTKGIIQPQSATVVIDQSNGEIKALVGGRSNNGEKVVNRAAMPRQTGSVMKPLGAYLPALDNGYTAATPIDDVPFINEKGKVWPNNYDFRSRGLVTLRESVEQSINTNAVKTVNDVGVKKSMSYLEKMGIISKKGDEDSFITAQENPEYNDENLSALALGGFTHGVSPVRMTGAYASIANKGEYIKPRAYSRILDRNGNEILKKARKPVKVVSPQTAYVMTDILHSTVSNGLGIAQKARITPDNETIPVAGKTGTTDQNADVWFMGYTPYYTAGVWVGNDSMSVKLNRDSGLASEIWSTVMKKVHENSEPKSFEEPADIVRMNVCTMSGKLPTEKCQADPRGVVKEELFAKGTEPTEECEQHQYFRIHMLTGKLAGPNCPNYLTTMKLFFRREPEYKPEDHNNVIPEDYQYDPPKETTYCN